MLRIIIALWTATELRTGEETEAMKYVKQPTNQTCGQACIAMIKGKTVEEVIAELDTDKGLPPEQLIAAMEKLGIRHDEDFTAVSRRTPMPEGMALLLVQTNYGYSHWTIWMDGRIYDPKFGIFNGEYPHGKMVQYMRVYPEG